MREAVIAATLEALAAGDPTSLSIPAIAAAAGVSPSTVYRRWPERADLITDALAGIADATVPLASTGTLRGDLIAFAEDLADALARPDLRALVRSLIAHDAPAADEVRRAFWDRRLAASAEIVTRAEARGELPPETRAPELIERIAAPIWMRTLLTALSIDRPWLERLVDETVAGVGAGNARPGP